MATFSAMACAFRLSTASRPDTVQELEELVRTHNVVFVRGPPKSGKTELALLLRHHLKTQGKPVIYHNHWTHSPGNNGSLHEENGKVANDEELLVHAKKEGFNINRTTLLEQEVFWILDDVHHTYQDKAFWTSFIRRYPNTRKNGICLFAQYGDPLFGVDIFSFDPFASRGSAWFGPQQRVSTTPKSDSSDSPQFGIYFTMSECYEYLERFCSHPSSSLKLDPSAMDYIFDLTKGHPGALAALIVVLSNLTDYFHRDPGTSITLKTTIMDLLEGKLKANFFIKLHDTPFGESLASGTKLTPESLRILRQAVLKGSIPFNQLDSGVRQCVEEGWLCVDFPGLSDCPSDLVCTFPTPLHSRMTQFLLMTMGRNQWLYLN